MTNLIQTRGSWRKPQCALGCDNVVIGGLNVNASNRKEDLAPRGSGTWNQRAYLYCREHELELINIVKAAGIPNIDISEISQESILQNQNREIIFSGLLLFFGQSFQWIEHQSFCSYFFGDSLGKSRTHQCLKENILHIICFGKLNNFT